MKTVIHNIGTLAGILPEGTLRLEGEAMNNVGCIDNAYLTIEVGRLRILVMRWPKYAKNRIVTP